LSIADAGEPDNSLKYQERKMHVLKKIVAVGVLACPMFASAGPVVDVNTATAESLADAITGVGLDKAQAIVAYRSANGPFQSVDDLALVKGIGSKTIEKNRDVMTLDAGQQ
jgi:competence protein ComEA